MKRSSLLSALILLTLAATGTALAQEAPEEASIMGRNFFEMFLKGGFFMWPILLCSIVMLAFVFERLVSLRAPLIFPPKLQADVRAAVREGNIEAAIRLAKEDRSPFARLLYACLSRADASGFEMENALEEAGSRVLYDLRKNAKPLGVIADISPLLGLMGTVQGMIMAFEIVAKLGALGRADKLAESIAVALLTTAFGLAVAIPSTIFYHSFRGKAEMLLRDMEDACLDLMEDLRKQKQVKPR